MDKSLQMSPIFPSFPPAARPARSHTAIKDIVYRQEKALVPPSHLLGRRSYESQRERNMNEKAEENNRGLRGS